MTDDEKQLALIERDLDQVRQRLATNRALLAEQLAPHGFNPDTVDVVLSGIDEFGAAHVTQSISREPERYNLTELPPARQTIVNRLVDELGDGGYEFDRLVVAREEILARTDPEHQRVFPWFGRELAFSDDGKTLRLVGSTVEVEPATIVAVPNRGAPSIEPDASPDRVRVRRRDRDR